MLRLETDDQAAYHGNEEEAMEAKFSNASFDVAMQLPAPGVGNQAMLHELLPLVAGEAIAADSQVLVADVPVMAAAVAHSQLEHNWGWNFAELMVGPRTGVSVGDDAAGTVVVVLSDLTILRLMQGVLLPLQSPLCHKD